MCPDGTSAVAPGSPKGSDSSESEPDVRDAVIWISGLSETSVAEALPGIATRIAVALDNETPEASTSFSVNTSTSEELGGDSVPACTILRTDTAADGRAVIDVFGVSVEDQLVGPARALPLWKQAVYGGPVVLAAAVVLIKRFRQNIGKSPRERWQLFYALMMVLLMAVAFVLLVGAFVASLRADDVLGAPKLVAAGLLAVGGWGLWKSPWAKKVRAAGLTLYAVYRYIERADASGAVLHGNLARVLDMLESHPEDVRYDHIVTIAYSFGSLVALDACFSPTTDPPERLSAINVLVTVGCPYDCVRALRPDYAGPRYGRDSIPARWVNVYSPSDVLSSNFRDDETPGDATVQIVLRDHPSGGRLPQNVIYRIDGRDGPVAFDESLLLRGLTYHARYWDKTDDHAVSVFGPVVKEAFAGRPSLI